ncbi:MAG: nucleotidyltransferase domain-containing protein [Acidobacteria bacterium]|nr:nucleotidyltransferase domain-containing protein [Acidobacteriota bacterium]
MDALGAVLAADSRVSYALLFGSRARGEASGHSDTDLAVGLVSGTKLTAREVGDLVSRLESATDGSVDLVLLDEANPGLAYRIFRDGHVVLAKDPAALAERRARAILEYLDFKPIEDVFTQAVLETRAHG